MGLSADLVSSPHSYWQRSVEQDRARQIRAVDTLPDRCTIAIVGAGLLGVSTAYFLARTGVDVVVLDRAGIAAGATGRNAGFVVSGPAESYQVAIERYGHTVARAVHQFTIENRELLRVAVAEDGIDCDYREPGYLSLATTEQEWLQHEDANRVLQADGIPSQLLNRSELQSCVGVPLRPHILGARRAPEEGQIHPARLLYGLARSAMSRGVRFAFPYNVAQLARIDNGWTLTVEDGHTRTRIKAERVLCATNAWLPSLVPALQGIITPVRGQVIATAPMSRIFPCAMSADHGLQYWQQLPDGRIVLGGGRMAVADQEVGYADAHLRSEVQAALDRYLGSLFVGLEQLVIEHRWAGVMGFSRDALPFIGAVPPSDGLFVAGGFTGHGMPFGLRAGQALAESLTTGRVSAALAPFRLDRPLT